MKSRWRYGARPDEIEEARDLDALNRVAFLLGLKTSRLMTFGQFDRGDERGFVSTVEGDLKRMFAEVFVPGMGVGFGVHFIDEGGVGVGQVEEFLGVLRVEVAGK